MKILFAVCLIYISCLNAIADDKIVRDANGAVIATIDRTSTGVTVRDVAGKLVESRQRSGSTLIVRDPSGKVIRKEVKKQ